MQDASQIPFGRRVRVRFTLSYRRFDDDGPYRLHARLRDVQLMPEDRDNVPTAHTRLIE